MIRRQSGFTLIEILVSIAIFAMIAVASTAILSNVIGASEESQDAIIELEQVQRAMMVFEQDIYQAVARPVRTAGQDNSQVFLGGLGEFDSLDDGFGFVRTGWNNPQWRLPRSNMQSVAYRLNQDNQLERLHTIFVDSMAGTEPKSRVLLEDITSFNVEYAKLNSRKEVAWDNEYAGEQLPPGIAIEISSQSFGTIRREFALLNIAIPQIGPLAPTSNTPENPNTSTASDANSTGGQ